MRNFLLFLLCCLVSSAMWAQTTLLFEDFEDATVTYTVSPAGSEYSDGNGDYFTSTANNAIGAAFTGFSNIQGTHYFAAQDVDDGGMQAVPQTLVFSNIDISGFSNLTFSGFFAEDDDGTSQDWDAADFVRIRYSIDGGTPSELLGIENDGSTFNSAPFVDTDFDGIGDGVEITNVFQELTANIAGTGSTLDLFIVVSLNSGDEDIAFDNITIEGMPSVAGCNELFFSEYVEGSGNERYLEVYNPTASPIDLSNYAIRRYANGTTSPLAATLSGTLAPYSAAVFKNTNASGPGTSLFSITHTGDDAYDLYNAATMTVTDIFGNIGNDPGSAWTGPGGYSTRDKTLRRKSMVTVGVTTNPGGTGPSAFTTLTTEWDLFDINTIDGLGSHTSDCAPASACTITNVVVTNLGCDNGTGSFPNDSYFDISFDVVGGSGNYRIYNPANGFNYNDPPAGTLGTSGTINSGGQANAAAAPGSTAQIVVEDQGNGCQSAPVTIVVPFCPANTCPGVGDLVITEILQNPSVVGDNEGEWFEVYNPTGSNIDMQGMTIRDNDNDSHVISSSVIVPAGGYAVLGRNADTNVNGGVAVNYAYGMWFLANSSDEVIIECGGTIIDQVWYDNGATFPDPNGASMQLKPDMLNATANDMGSAWCTSTTVFGGGDLGTPGAPNSPVCCEVTIDNVVLTPPSCPDSMDGGLEVVATGAVGTVSYTIAGPVNATNNTGVFTNLPAGGYAITVADAGVPNCTDGTFRNLNSTDNTPPTITSCMGLPMDFNGETNLSVADYITTTANDNCGTPEVSFVPEFISCGQVGTTVPVVVTWTDNAGNPSVCTAIITVGGLPCGAMTPVSHVDCGQSSASYDANANTFDVTAVNCQYGAPYSTDEQAFVKYLVCGNGEITARVENVDGNGWAGIQMRVSSAPDAPKVSLSINGTSNFARREVRYVTGGTAVPAIFPTFNASWLRLRRTGDFITGYVSKNGSRWRRVMAVRVEFPPCLETGMFVTNYNANSTVTGVFSNVSVSGTNTSFPTSLIADNADVAVDGWSDSDQFAVEGELGAISVNTYPNPVAGQLMIELAGYEAKDVQLRLVDAQGRIVKQRELGEVFTQTERMDVSTLAVGVYHLYISSADAAPQIKRVVVQRP